MGPLRVLGLSGSLRDGSVNTAVIKAARLLAPAGMVVEPFAGLDALPFFNPDLEDERLPVSVVRLRQAVGACDAVLICSPEYAHGVSGLLKNALDWLVPSVEFPETPVAVVNASPFSHHAHDALLETLRTMSARLTAETVVTLPWSGRKPELPDLTQDPVLTGPLSAMLEALETLARAKRPLA